MASRSVLKSVCAGGRGAVHLGKRPEHGGQASGEQWDRDRPDRTGHQEHCAEKFPPPLPAPELPVQGISTITPSAGLSCQNGTLKETIYLPVQSVSLAT